MLLVRAVARRRDDHDRNLRVGPAAHEVDRDLDGPVHRRDRRGGIVRPVAHVHHGDARLADPVVHRTCELAIDPDAHRDGASPLREVPGHGAGVDHGHRAFDMDVVRGEDDRDLGPCRREPPAELLHRRRGRGGEGRAVRRLRFGDGHRAVRRDAREDQRHPAEYGSLDLALVAGR